jgi:ketoreductase RED1
MSRDVTKTDPAGTQLVQPSPPDARTVLRQFEKVTLVGAGTLGISWAALFLGHGLQVCVNDPRPDIEDRVTDGLRRLTPTLDTLGLDTRRIAQRVEFESAIDRAVEEADVIQESGPEDLALKRELFARIGRAMRPTALVLSSTALTHERCPRRWSRCLT